MNQSIALPGDSLVSMSAESDCELAWKDQNPDYGRSSFDWSVTYDPNTCSWRTSQVCLTGESAEFSEIWPRAGMMRSGVAYRLHSLDIPTFGSGFSLLPTPGAQPHGVSGSNACYQLRSQIGRDFFYAQETEALMGFPENWTDLEFTGTPSSPIVPNGSEDAS